MQCSNCGKRNHISIKNRLYCADCGESLSHPHPSPAPVSTSQPDSGHILDLSAIIPPRPKRPAQSIHGVRKSGRAPKKLTAIKRRDLSARKLRATKTQRHTKIDKFSRSIDQKTNAATPRPVIPMAPHRMYRLNQQLSKSHLEKAAKSTLHDARYSTKPSLINRYQKFVSRFVSRFRGKPRLLPALSVVFTVIALAAYITYLNVPSIAVKIAASRAGIEARMPNYRPPGYSYSGPINFQRGKVEIRFMSNTDSRYLAISQEITHWDSETLRESIISETRQQPRRNLHNGLAIYVYEGNNAAWINNGLLYRITGNSLLDEAQILRIASSL